MEPISALILGGASLAGGLFGQSSANQAARWQANFNAEQAAIQRAWSAHEAGTQRAWLQRMSNTAHRREVRDLYKAGLNPILSAGGGPGASTPGAVMPSSSPASMNQADVTSGLALARMITDIGESLARMQKTQQDITKGEPEATAKGWLKQAMDKVQDWMNTPTKSESAKNVSRDIAAKKLKGPDILANTIDLKKAKKFSMDELVDQVLRSFRGIKKQRGATGKW